MNKGEFTTYISDKNKITKAEASKMLDMFTSSVIDALGEGKEISLIGFGSFSISKIPDRDGRNPRTGQPLRVPAYNQVKFKVGQKMKNAVNK